MKRNVTIKHPYLAIGVIALSSILACSCSEDEKPAERRAIDFAQNYYNMRYNQAIKLCTKESRKWIEYKASNIYQSDIDVINSQSDTACSTIDDIVIGNDETSAIAKVTINNVLTCDTIGKRGIMAKEIKRELPMKKISGEWYVDLKQPI